MSAVKADHLVPEMGKHLRKLRDDQRAAKADLALIVSHALPKGLQTFDHIDGVWVTEPRCAVPIGRRNRVHDIVGPGSRGEGRRGGGEKPD